MIVTDRRDLIRGDSQGRAQSGGEGCGHNLRYSPGRGVRQKSVRAEHDGTGKDFAAVLKQQDEKQEQAAQERRDSTAKAATNAQGSSHRSKGWLF